MAQKSAAVPFVGSVATSCSAAGERKTSQEHQAEFLLAVAAVERIAEELAVETLAAAADWAAYTFAAAAEVVAAVVEEHTRSLSACCLADEEGAAVVRRIGCCRNERTGDCDCGFDHRSEGDPDTSEESHGDHSHHGHDRHHNDHENGLGDNESHRGGHYTDLLLCGDNHDHGPDCVHESDHSGPLEGSYPKWWSRSVYTNESVTKKNSARWSTNPVLRTYIAWPSLVVTARGPSRTSRRRVSAHVAIQNTHEIAGKVTNGASLDTGKFIDSKKCILF